MNEENKRKISDMNKKIETIKIKKMGITGN